MIDLHIFIDLFIVYLINCFCFFLNFFPLSALECKLHSLSYYLAHGSRVFILLYFITKLNESSLNLMTANMQSMPKMMIILSSSADIADFTVHYHACVVILASDTLVETLTQQSSVRSNMHVISNRLDFNQEGVASDIPSKIITSYTKADAKAFETVADAIKVCSYLWVWREICI